MKQRKSTIEVLHFFVLVLGLCIASIIFYELEDVLNKFFVTLVTAFLYVAWGAWHHSYSERYNKLIFFEYSLVSFIAILLTALGLGIFRFF